MWFKRLPDFRNSRTYPKSSCRTREFLREDASMHFQDTKARLLALVPPKRNFIGSHPEFDEFRLFTGTTSKIKKNEIPVD